jgi:sec-independent protein translocase protein TatA
MVGLDSWWHWLVLAIVVAALFFSNKLPDAARSLGRSMRIFKTEIKGMREDDKAREEASAEPKQLPAADVVKREQQAAEQPPSRPRPSPSPRARS